MPTDGDDPKCLLLLLLLLLLLASCLTTKSAMEGRNAVCKWTPPFKSKMQKTNRKCFVALPSSARTVFLSLSLSLGG